MINNISITMRQATHSNIVSSNFARAPQISHCSRICLYKHSKSFVGALVMSNRFTAKEQIVKSKQVFPLWREQFYSSGTMSEKTWHDQSNTDIFISLHTSYMVL